MNRFKQLFRVLYVWDGIWSIPLSFLMVIMVAIVGQWIFGPDFAFFGPDIIQAAVVSSLMLVVFNLVTLFGLYFNAKPLFDYLTGRGFKTDFLNLPVWQKILFSLGSYFFYLLLLVAIFSVLV